MTMLVRIIWWYGHCQSTFEERQNEIIAGNVSFYGATGGKAFINGSAEKDSVLEIVV